MKMIPAVVLLSLSSILIFAPIPAYGDMAFSNFGPGHSYACCAAGMVSGPDAQPSWVTEAVQFTSAVTGNVSQIDLALAYFNGSSNSATVSLWTDNGGFPGAQLGLWGISGLFGWGTCCSIDTITGIVGVTVNAGQNYFLMASAPGNTIDFWDWNLTQDFGLIDVSIDGGRTWTQNPNVNRLAFDVLTAGPGAPEPSTLLSFGSAMAYVIGRFRRKMTP